VNVFTPRLRYNKVRAKDNIINCILWVFINP
jgi:hypothetical protein